MAQACPINHPAAFTLGEASEQLAIDANEYAKPEDVLKAIAEHAGGALENVVLVLVRRSVGAIVWREYVPDPVLVVDDNGEVVIEGDAG